MVGYLVFVVEPARVGFPLRTGNKLTSGWPQVSERSSLILLFENIICEYAMVPLFMYTVCHS